VVYEDEVDIHLNPKVGLDWMNEGTQKKVMTPGKNAKAYLAGTLDARDGTLLWVGGTVKNSGLFVSMLERLELHYTAAKRIPSTTTASTRAPRSTVLWRDFHASACTFCRPIARTTTESNAFGWICTPM
jgi:hypothetical protein